MANLVDSFKEIRVDDEEISGIKSTLIKDNYGKFTISPLEKGYGLTIGNSLRRVLLSSLPGASVFAVQIEGVDHEFSALEGVVEDITKIILNLKGLILKIGDSETTDGQYQLSLSINGAKEVTAADIECPSEVEIINPELVIAHVSDGGKLNMRIFVRNGRGYVTSDGNKLQKFYKDKYANVMHIIATDSNYSPVTKVAYTVEPTRVQHDSNYDKLVIEVETNGSITPQDAIALAGTMLVRHFEKVAEIVKTYEPLDLFQEEMVVNDEEPQTDGQIEDLELSARGYNCLKRANISTIKELLLKSEGDLSRVRNLGKKSIKEIKDKLRARGLSLKEDGEFFDEDAIDEE